MESSLMLGGVGLALSFVSMLIAALTAKHSVRRDTIRDLVRRIETLEADLAECERKHRAAEERNVTLMERLIGLKMAAGDWSRGNHRIAPDSLEPHGAPA